MHVNDKNAFIYLGIINSTLKAKKLTEVFVKHYID